MDSGFRSIEENHKAEIKALKEAFLKDPTFNPYEEEIAKLQQQLSNEMSRTSGMMKDFSRFQARIEELEDTLQNTIIELETYKHDALLWSMVDSPLLREQAQKLLDKKQEEHQEIEY